MKEIVLPVEELKELCVEKLLQARLNSEHAYIVADVLIHANLRGVDSHGVMRMEHYIRRLTSGGINPRPHIQIEETGPATAVVDGDDGFGHVIAKEGMQAAISLADRSGIGMVTMKNSSHCGALSYFVNQAAKRQMIGMMMTNTDKFVVPFGASKAFFGTNPLAYGFPSQLYPPIIVDMATSQVAVGKVFHAREAGKSIPLDWGVDRAGKPTADPAAVAALFPFGGQKGSALAMVVDLFSGILANSSFGPHVSVMYGDYSNKRKLGHFTCVIDISRFLEKSVFLQQVDQFIEEMHALEPAEGFASVLVPGEPEHAKELSRLREGIPIPVSIYKFLSS